MMEAHFLTKPGYIALTPVPQSTDWVVRGNIRYYSKVLGREIVVKDCFITDLASVPRAFWWIYPPSGLYDLAVILHDWLFWMQACTFDQANAVLREAMLVCGCTKSAADHFHLAVSVGSKGVWKKYAAMRPEDRLTGLASIIDGVIYIPPSAVNV